MRVKGPLILKDRSAPSTPSTGEVALYSVDGSALLLKDDAGVVRTLAGTVTRTVSGRYSYSQLCVVQASATNGTTTGFWWLYNPVASGIKIALNSVGYMSQHAGALVTVTSPRLSLALFTFTGTPSGTAGTVAKNDSTFSTATGLLQTTQAGSSNSLGAIIMSFFPVWNQSTSSGGPGGATDATWDPADAGDEIILAAGEGIVCYQPDAGTTSDVRRQLVNLVWTEYT